VEDRPEPIGPPPAETLPLLPAPPLLDGDVDLPPVSDVPELPEHPAPITPKTTTIVEMTDRTFMRDLLANESLLVPWESDDHALSGF
jgi:hypothetical protein